MQKRHTSIETIKNLQLCLIFFKENQWFFLEWVKKIHFSKNVWFVLLWKNKRQAETYNIVISDTYILI